MPDNPTGGRLAMIKKIGTGEFFDMDSVEQRIGVPHECWPGRCHEIADMLLKHKVVVGKLRYGHWLGPVHHKSIFAGRPVVPHGWIDSSGTIVDPTRWVFEMAKPYVFVGENDFYDVGGNRFRTAMHSKLPRLQGLKVDLKISSDLKEFMLGLVRHPYLTNHSLSWIANQSPDTLGVMAKRIYLALKGAGMRCYVPIDNWQLIMEG